MIDPPHGYEAIVRVFGDPKFDGEKVDPAWESANMVSFRHPALPHGKLYVHKLIVEPLGRALSQCVALGDGYQIVTIGCFSPRLKRGIAQMSVHTFGAAVDINEDTNHLIKSCAPDDARRTAPGAKDIPDAWIACFERNGLFWGGRFFYRFDAMHFQYCTGY